MIVPCKATDDALPPQLNSTSNHNAQRCLYQVAQPADTVRLLGSIPLEILVQHQQALGHHMLHQGLLGMASSALARGYAPSLQLYCLLSQGAALGRAQQGN